MNTQTRPDLSRVPAVKEIENWMISAVNEIKELRAAANVEEADHFRDELRRKDVECDEILESIQEMAHDVNRGIRTVNELIKHIDDTVEAREI
jgi:cysteinyl-tRNA synthetase